MVGRTAFRLPLTTADLLRVQCLHTEVVADTAVLRLRTVVVDARCHRMAVAADTPCRPTVVEDSAEAARLPMAEAEVTHPRTEEVAVVDVLPAAEAAGMPRLRAAVEATAAEAGPKMVAAITATTKF